MNLLIFLFNVHSNCMEIGKAHTGHNPTNCRSLSIKLWIFPGYLIQYFLPILFQYSHCLKIAQFFANLHPILNANDQNFRTVTRKRALDCLVSLLHTYLHCCDFGTLQIFEISKYPETNLRNSIFYAKIYLFKKCCREHGTIGNTVGKDRLTLFKSGEGSRLRQAYRVLGRSAVPDYYLPWISGYQRQYPTIQNEMRSS